MLQRLSAALKIFFTGGALVKDQTKEAAPMWLVIGLGNPGTEHAEQHHNVGFMAIDRMAADYNFPSPRQKFNAHIIETSFNGDKVLWMKPQTFMNLSGKSVAEAARFYKIAPDNIIVLHDELDLPVGKVKVKQGGGSAGHNGLKSMDECLGESGYTRIRIGIGHPGDKARVSGYVLSRFDADELHVVDLALAAISRHFELVMTKQDTQFMTKLAADIKLP